MHVGFSPEVSPHATANNLSPSIQAALKPIRFGVGLLRDMRVRSNSTIEGLKNRQGQGVYVLRQVRYQAALRPAMGRSMTLPGQPLLQS
jgi:hypothetical protein